MAPRACVAQEPPVSRNSEMVDAACIVMGKIVGTIGRPVNVVATIVMSECYSEYMAGGQGEWGYFFTVLSQSRGCG